MSNTNIFFLIIIVITIVVSMFIKLIKYKKTLDEKNVLLIQFYLDTKFLCGALVDSLKSNNTSEYCAELVGKIKDYYNLEDIIIIDSIKSITNENNTLTRSKILNYILSNSDKVLDKLHDHNLVSFNYNNEDNKYRIYISRIVDLKDSNGIIACIEKAPSLLNKQELESLENCINLLKTRIIFD